MYVRQWGFPLFVFILLCATLYSRCFVSLSVYTALLGHDYYYVHWSNWDSGKLSFLAQVTPPVYESKQPQKCFLFSMKTYRFGHGRDPSKWFPVYVWDYLGMLPTVLHEYGWNRNETNTCKIRKVLFTSEIKHNPVIQQKRILGT